MEMENLERLHQKMEDLTGFEQSTWGVFAIQKQLQYIYNTLTYQNLEISRY
jgi:hypothetical protein